MTNITQMTSPINEMNTPVATPGHFFWKQLVSITYATRALFLGSAFLHPGRPEMFNTDPPYMVYNMPAGQPSFLEIQVGSDGVDSEFIWGDVLKGIEEMSHNVTVALLTLQLGTMSANCSFDHQDVVYQYSSHELWAPYGVSTMLDSHVSILPFPYYVL
jgi:hypothetical protein